MIKTKTSVKNVLLENTVENLQHYSANKCWFPVVQLVGIVSSCKAKQTHLFKNAQLLYDLSSQGLKERKTTAGFYEVKATISYLFKHFFLFLVNYSF